MHPIKHHFKAATFRSRDNQKFQSRMQEEEDWDLWSVKKIVDAIVKKEEIIPLNILDVDCLTRLQECDSKDYPKLFKKSWLCERYRKWNWIGWEKGKKHWTRKLNAMWRMGENFIITQSFWKHKFRRFHQIGRLC